MLSFSESGFLVTILHTPRFPWMLGENRFSPDFSARWLDAKREMF